VSSLGPITINGGAGDDRISSNGKDNVLIGGAGSDIFVMDFWSKGSIIQDLTSKDFILITDYFASTNDKVGLDLLNPLIVGSEPTANSTSGQLLYDTDDGRLLYDRDGTGITDAVHMFTLATKPKLSMSNFILDF
jgi:Ca2+-binding RTX toxin-like protein